MPEGLRIAMPRGKSRKLTPTPPLSGLPVFLKSLQRPAAIWQSPWEAIIKQVLLETSSWEQSIGVIFKIKFNIWVRVPFIVLHFGDYPTPRSRLERNDEAFREVLEQYFRSRPSSQEEFGSIGGELLKLAAFRCLILEGIRQKFFPYLESDFISLMYPASVDLLRTIVGADALYPSDYSELFLIALDAPEEPFVERLLARMDRVLAAEERLKLEAERLGLDWHTLIEQRWGSSFAIRRSYSRFPFLRDVVCDLWRLLAPYYGVGLSNPQPFVTTQICRHISAVMQDDLPKLTKGLDARAVKDILSYRYDQSEEEGETVGTLGVYSCFSCGKTICLKAGDTAPRCKSHHEEDHVSRFWRWTELKGYPARKGNRRGSASPQTPGP